ncbi:Leucyl-tRNA_synthetase [Hexamita inflata]|uniref:leucine--tRNA ligase n=1 Tax=Hexamita inflata TaxID=28002 RepID=A0AA86NY96_9EUKA|nr:Leucyl-tRNA synthetase [Hexamita inflata]
MNSLKKGGYITYGNRNTIWSPADGQPCMDHDRLSGEGIQVQEYVIVLTELLRSHVNNNAVYGSVAADETVFLACATLRPETMCGQTNVWIKPDGEYLLIRIGDMKVIVTSKHAANNMAYQGFNNGKPMGEMDVVKTILGKDLINCIVHAPLTPYPEIPVLPLLTISMTKGTGVVTSVPSDAPDDYAALKDVLTNNENIVTEYNIDLKLLENIKPIEIIEIPEYGRAAASRLCEERGVKSQHDKELLKEIKDLCYTKGFYEGVMISGPFTGNRVQDCKVLCRTYLVERGQAFVYGEPEAEIIARSGCVCVVAKTDQWFIDYGEEKWKQAALDALSRIDTYNDEVKSQFERVLDWLKQWALSRTFGLGTRIPWDEQFLVESLSDSTIYNAFYTIADVLQNSNLYGDGCPVDFKLLDDDFFDYVFDLSDTIQEKHKQYTEIMQKLKQSFTFYYPVDLRCSGKDLVPNHLTFFIYNHCAVWSKNPEYWPRGIRANGHLMLNEKKMSKSTGNFMTAIQSIETYSADGVRYALADAGDGNDDANFKTDTAVQAGVKLTQLLAIDQAILSRAVERENINTTKDLIFQAQFYDCAARCNKQFERCLFREGMITLMNEMNKARDLYIKTCDQENEHPAKSLVFEFIKLQTQLIATICPHIAEEIYHTILGFQETIFKSALDQEYLDQQQFKFAKYQNTYEQIQSMIARLKYRYTDAVKPKKDGTIPPKPKTGVVYVATEFLEWQAQVITYLGEEYAKCGGNFDKSIIGNARAYALDTLKVDAKETKKIVKLVSDVLALAKTEGQEAFVVKMPFDEKLVYQEYSFLMCQSMFLEKVDVYRVGEGPLPAEKCGAAQPGRPIIFFDM